MVEAPSSKLLWGRLTFIGLAFAILFAQLLPIDNRPERWPFPDLLLAATFVWVVRRPDYAPVLVIGLTFLLADLLLQRPPGLWAALVVAGTEVVRARSKGLRDFPLLLEWATVGGVIIALVLIKSLILALSMTPYPPLGMQLLQIFATILVYPIMVLVARFIFGVTRPALGEVDTFGHRI